MTLERSRMRWNGWGWRDHPDPLAGRAAVWPWIAEALGVAALPDTPARPLEDIVLPPSRLDDKTLAALRAILGDERVRVDKRERAFHARGRSYHDLLHLRAGRLEAAPDAVLYPSSEDEVIATLALAAGEGIAVIPFGGGTSVVGGVTAEPGPGQGAVITLDTTAMNKLLGIDRQAMTARFEAGIDGPALEGALASAGLTLGHYPQSFEFSTLGGWIAARGAGQQSYRYGKAEKWLAGLRLATAAGVLTTHDFPASAAGPDLNQLVLGSEGIFGVITEATVKLHTAPAVKDYRGYLLKDFAAGLEAVRALCQADLPIAMARLSDADETHYFRAFAEIGHAGGAGRRLKAGLARAVLRLRRFSGHPCLLLIGAEGDAATTAYAGRHAARLVRAHGGLALGRSPGARWHEGRFAGPYSRDPMLDRGLGVDTLETATRWSNIAPLYAGVREALLQAMRETAASPGARGIVLGHVSHAYRDGASLYFTFLFPRDREDAIGQWRHIKAAASSAIIAHGGTISHHHGVGTDHAAWLAAEKGEVGLAALRAVKAGIDPQAILNPGKLLAAPPE
ncbi:MAG: FAD-binding oxidoreductase [Pseudomonadota bacterium]